MTDQIEDPEERAKQEAVKNFVGPPGHVGKPSAHTAADNDERISDTEEVSCPHRRSQDFVWGALFLTKKLTTFF